ncbi:hypothetical protein IAQ61_008704 [Plenodomus lingam]|uniref:uncharacterized protein n=1 Tax=Leptosphaeria maculans TaxID=5022 RepID=UPI00332DC8B5|nr:hypothetical protein IAQ61_008704 [Plenodomus lingam]
MILLSTLFLPLFVQVNQISGLVLSSRDNPDPPPAGWSKEAILALIGVCMAIVCFIITLAWPTIRGLFQTNSMSCINARRRRSRALEEQVRRYNEWLEFNEWREGRDHVD